MTAARTGTRALPRPKVNALQPLPAEKPRPASPAEQPLPSRWPQAGVDELVEVVRQHKHAAGLARGSEKPSSSAAAQGAGIVLGHLATLPGESWNDRWSLFDAQTVGQDWPEVIRPNEDRYTRHKVVAGLDVLFVLDVVRPSYAWQHKRRLNVYNIVGQHRDPDAFATFSASTDRLSNASLVKQVRQMLGQIQLHTGKSMRQVNAQDVLDLDAAFDRFNATTHFRRATEHLWRTLMELGWIEHESLRCPVVRVRQPQMTPAEMVDHYGVSSPHREVLIEYLKQRRVALDYATFRNLGQELIKNFWLDIDEHHPGLPTFALTREISAKWKERLRVKRNGEERVSHINELFAVRAFYLDMAQWALEDSYWVPWAAPSPISRAEVGGYAKLRRKQVARTQQRTRQIASVLPQLVAQAEKDRRTTRRCLEEATEAGTGATVQVDGQAWTVKQVAENAPVWLSFRGETLRNVTYEEDNAFWTWAIVETFRLTGIRREELSELTHLSIVPYRVPSAGEEIPLLHISPSKTDEERLLVAGPELVRVLAEVVHRVRGEQQAVPLTQRWDHGEHEFSDPLPHLFCRWFGPVQQPISGATVLKMLHELAARADIRIHGEQIAFTSHDFRRVFATEALASGLPPHIVQVLLGHKSIATTQVYAAVYPEDVIRHHRTWIGQRRMTRPSEEYRQPTAAEWEEFEGHFVKRKVSLGTCGRAYGTNCHHEHACVRCALLRPDPAQIDRFRDIVENLTERIAEAEQKAWLGEVEGLKISLSAAEDKLAQMDYQDHDEGPVDLGHVIRLRSSEGRL